jgi:hypothetical protein
MCERRFAEKPHSKGSFGGALRDLSAIFTEASQQADFGAATLVDGAR